MENEREIEKDKTSTSDCCSRDSKFFRHRFSPLRLCVMFFGMVIIFGGIFALGRISSNHGMFGRANTVRNIQIESSGIANHDNFRQGGRGGMMSGRRAGRGQQLGEVTAINGNTLTVKINNVDSTITVTDATSYSKAGNIAKQSDLKVGDTISIVGSSDSQGNIAATVISIR